jgi:hypothetical protein
VSEGLSQDLQVDVYVTRGLAKTDLFIQDLSALLREYESATSTRDGVTKPSRLRFSIIEPKTEEEKEAAKKEGLQEALLGEGSETGDQTTIATGFMGIVLKYGSEKEVIPFWPPGDATGIEFFLTNKIREVRDRADKLETKIGLITGKDELKITDNAIAPGNQPFNLKQIFDEYFPFYKFEDVDLQGGEAEINKELAGIIITQPAKEYTEKELRRIDQFLMLGNKAAVFYVSAVNLKAADATMKATLNTWGLEKLLDGYGVELKKEAILDFGGGFRMPAQTQMGQPVWVMSPSVTMLSDDDRYEGDQALMDTKFPAFFRMKQVSFPFPSPLVPHPEKQPEAQVKVVARTTPRSFVDASEAIDMKYSTEWREKGEAGQRAIAIAVEGVLGSAFPTGDKAGVEAPAKSASPSRVLVLSSSQFLANPFARSGNPPPMPPQLAMMGAMGGDRELQMLARPYFEAAFRPLIFSFKNTIDWMANDADLIAVSAKLLGDPALSYSSIKKPEVKENETEEEAKKKFEAYKQERADVQRRVQWTLIFLPAVLFAGYGILRWRRREAERDAITL